MEGGGKKAKRAAGKGEVSWIGGENCRHGKNVTEKGGGRNGH